MTQAEFQVSTGNSPTLPDNSNWLDVNLPDDWRDSKPGANELWYRIQFNGDKLIDDEMLPLAVYIGNVTHTAAVYLNDLWIGQAGHFSDPVSRYHNQPLLFEFSPKLLKPGVNEVKIRVKSALTDYGLLSSIYIDQLSILKPGYAFKTLVRKDVAQWITIVMVLMALVVLIFYIARPQDAVYGIFSAELFIWAAHNLNLFVNEIPVSTWLWEAMTMVTLGWAVILMVFFNHRFVGKPVKIVERLMILSATLSFGLFLLPSLEQIFFIGYRVWNVLLVIFGCYALGYLLKQFKDQPDRDKFLMILSGVPILTAGLHDILVVNQFLPRTDGLIIQYSVLPPLLLFSWFLIRRFIQSINQAEDLSRNLEKKVLLREQELADQFEQVKRLEQDQLLSSERERIMRDMHDGIGSQLVSLVSTLNQAEDEKLIDIRERIRHSLSDLRLVIDSLDPEMNDITTLLGTLRQHFQEALKQADINLIWDIQNLPDEGSTSPQQNLHILRIIQEAITNVIKHAKCSEVTLRTYLSNDVDAKSAEARRLAIEIEDNGVGFDLSSPRSGSNYGVENMQHRAYEIGGEFLLKSIETGTCVCLRIPIK